MDPELKKLKLSVPDCADSNLLMVMIYMRFCPKLIEFPFEGKKYSISQDTITFARKLNSRFQFTEDALKEKLFHVETRDSHLEHFILNNQNNKAIPKSLPSTYLKAAFDSSSVKGVFTAYFHEKIYDYAKEFYETNNYFPLRHCYSVLGITRVLQDVMVSNYRRHPNLSETDRFIQKDAYEVQSNDDAKLIEQRFPSFRCRVDIKLMGQGSPELQILSLSDDRATLTKPAWLQNNGTGYVIISCRGELDARLRAGIDGKFVLWLRGVYRQVTNDNSKLIPYWVDYTSLSINGGTVFNDVHPAWHDAPYRHTLNIKAGEEITLRITWLPHHSDA